MVITKKFIWLHFPKCAGTETQRLLQTVLKPSSEVTFDPHDQNNVIWHHSIANRQEFDKDFKVGNRDVICNIRRLPAWLLSRVHYGYSRAPTLKVTRSMLLSGEFAVADGITVKADWHAKLYSSSPVAHWIRTEHLAQDFKRVFSLYTDLSGVNVIDLVRKTNVTPISYIPSVEFYFSKQDLAILYASNPVWATIERKVYGDLYTIS